MEPTYYYYYYYYRPVGQAQDPTCNCFDTLNARRRHGWPALGDLTATACAFCAFYLECQIRSKDMKERGEKGFGLEGFHSLEGFRLRHADENEKENDFPSRECVQDVTAMQILGVMSTAGLNRQETGGGILARKLIPDKVNHRLIEEWLHLCRSGHVSCDSHEGGAVSVGTGQIPGFQVIDCTTGNIVSFASLSSSTSSGEQSQTPPEYVTLSYVWGQGVFEGPVKRQQRLSLPGSLPLTISDTIQVVQRLGYRYLWIDRYCIPQDDLPVKQIQIENMGRIYSRSVLTIIAAAGEGPEHGLPGVSERRRVEQLTVQVDALAEGNGISLALYDRPKLTIMDSKWYTRGWTYQEGLLSRRRIVFTDQMIRTLTRFALSLDDEESNFGYIFPRQITDWSNPDTIWDRINEFSMRQLSFDADTLDAVAGIFGMYTAENSNKPKGGGTSFFYGMPIAPFQLRDNDERLWVCELRSLWETDEDIPRKRIGASFKTSLTYQLVSSLLWSDSWFNLLEPDSGGDPFQQQLSHFRRPVFPSWTWAGWKMCMVRRNGLNPTVFDSRTKICVEYEAEAASSSSSAGLAQAPKATQWRRLDWERENEEILKLAGNGAYKIPARLIIRGTVLDVRLKWRNGEKNNPARKFGEWTFTSPEFVEGTTDRIPRELLERVEPGGRKGEGIQVLALILAVRTHDEGKPNALLVLMLRPVTRILNGRPETMFERVHKVMLNVEGEYKPEWTPLSKLLREMEVTLS
ncbi:hypothetical protein SMACR_07178 [Sordaria macrospora]|uniref:WGS project CABT00000000 data, contig 2.40 n=2 Tax=Sordaria macrospora TaxID=5147 RepID=F7W7R1_SORMK|nr:uncharacterized protein SMAC_07178 [Sordaria macrospora k-hell]KAA8631707.1 hypothetical protein SMACR_07178 [Sordaria macrospora]KAH7626073.1 heterokaryon incompatibility protein-domain-containing protein [Sordaria sp. MPI-SDFR-AT-0083]WPJ61251.1 hypothetical protein SMAC4_07178 [Sordaria macrospora]CCC13553.1 unnamed protein product [Sordaria macrospora k-hell]